MSLPDDKIFEIVVGMVLINSGYQQVAEGRVQGRGGIHQTDAFGEYFVDIPFVHRIELLAEAKYHNQPLSIAVGRDVLARVMDIDQHYNSTDFGARPESDTQRRTIKGAIFSKSGFAGTTLKFCYSHGIWCIDFPSTFSSTKLEDLVDEIRKFVRSGSASISLTAEERQVMDRVRSGQHWQLSSPEWKMLEDLIRRFVKSETMKHFYDDIARLLFGTLSTSTPILTEIPLGWKTVIEDTRPSMLRGLAEVDEKEEQILTIKIKVSAFDEPIILFLSRDLFSYCQKTQKILVKVLHRQRIQSSFIQIDIEGILGQDHRTESGNYSNYDYGRSRPFETRS